MAPPNAKKAFARLSELKEAGRSGEREGEVLAFLDHASNHVAARAVKLAAEWKLAEAVPIFERAFDRFLENPLESDKGCDGKTAIVQALCDMEQHRPGIYWRGIRYRQMEPVWDRKREDTAAGLRAACVRGLALMGHERVHMALAELVLDPECVAREGAIKTLGWLATSEAELVLHMKAVMGDAEPVVLGECCSVLMSHWPEDSFELVASKLGVDPEVTEQAALALAESRHEETFGRLVGAYEENLSDVKRVLLLPIALVRSEEAFAWLLEVVADEPEGLALAAIDALAIFDDGAERSRAMGEAAVARGGAVSRKYGELSA